MTLCGEWDSADKSTAAQKASLDATIIYMVEQLKLEYEPRRLRVWKVNYRLLHVHL